MDTDTKTQGAAGTLAGSALAVTAVALALGTFMQVLDGSIANVSLPTIVGNLGHSTDDGTWIITSFAVANAVMVPLTGWFTQRYGVVRTFVTSVILFTMASFLCGIAWDLPSLILFRVLQGGVSGPMIPGSQALLISVFPPQRRGLALSIWSATTLSAPALGPVLGGYISDNYFWGWIFLINVPFGIATAFITRRNLAGMTESTRKLKVDTVGLALLAFWVFSLQIVLDLGKNRDWFEDPLVTAFAISAAIGFALWIVWELTDAHPAVDLRLFRSRNFALGSLSICLGYALLFANNLLLPLLLQEHLRYTATWAGLVAAPSGVLAVLATPFAGRLRLDPRLGASLSFLCFGCSFLMRANYTPDADFLSLALPLFVQGVATALFFVPLLTISLDGIPPEKLASASGLSNFARITAGSFAASLVTTFWDRREALHQTALVEAISTQGAGWPGDQLDLGARGVSHAQSIGLLYQEVIKQAYLLSATDIFWVCGWVSFALIAILWFCKRPAPSDHVVAAD